MIVREMPGISGDAFANEIVKQYYRTAGVFSRYGIEYCCGAKFPLHVICSSHQIGLEQLLTELREAARDIRVSHLLPFTEWNIDFTIDYIVNVHHVYLRRNLPLMKTQLEKFFEEHRKKYPHLDEIRSLFDQLYRTTLPHLQQEEEVIFPYIRQIFHAWESKESYAGLLVRTLRKPVEELMHDEHDNMEATLSRFRALTEQYTAPASACTSHKLAFDLLRELDDDLVQHLYLENEVLFPRAIAMEKELLENHA